MATDSLTVITSIALITVPIAFNVTFFALARAFEYPDILRQPVAEILKKFSAGGVGLQRLWYLFALSALLAIPLSLLTMAVFYPQQPLLAAVSGIVGALSGLIQAVGLLRWSFLVPSLAQAYQATETTASGREAIGVVFNSFHQFVGVALGEHLGYILTAAWTVTLVGLMAGASVFSGLLLVVGIISAVGILVGLLEPAGWKPAGLINALSYLVWSGWLIVVGLTLLFA